MHCAGFSSDTYDRYVLGLLEEPERSQLEVQIQEQCPACLSGVQRSMNLWLVFATTLENAEPSEDFRGRLVRIAELSRKVLTFPKSSALRGRTNVLTSTLLMICGALAVLLVITWYAGRQSAHLDNTPITGELQKLTQEKAKLQVKLQAEETKWKSMESGLGVAGQKAVQDEKRLEGELSKARADIEQYKAEIARQQKASVDNLMLLGMLDNPGARLISMKGEASTNITAYVMVAENSRLIFVGYNLPKPPQGRKYQLWILRREDPKTVSAGLFEPANNGPTLVSCDQGPVISNIASIAVTEEASDGSDSPTGAKLLESGSSPAITATDLPAEFWLRFRRRDI